jgi:ribosomal 30S subunit maturation factor RimM
MENNDFLSIGKVVGTHGVKGALKVYSDSGGRGTPTLDTEQAIKFLSKELWDKKESKEDTLLNKTFIMQA